MNFEKISPKTFGPRFVSHKWAYTWSIVYEYTTKSSWNPKSNALEPDQLLYDRPTVGIITQQCSSTIFNWLPFPSHNKQFGSHFKMGGISEVLIFF